MDHLNWPGALDPNKAHIIVLFGEPLIPMNQQRKLHKFLQLVSRSEEWILYIPTKFYRGGFHGALFSSSDKTIVDEVLESVKVIKAGTCEADNREMIASDNLAYTDLQFINIEGDLQEAIDDDALVLDYLNNGPDPNRNSDQPFFVSMDAAIKDASKNRLGKKTYSYNVDFVDKKWCIEQFGDMFGLMPYNNKTMQATLEYKALCPYNMCAESEAFDNMWVYHILWLKEEVKKNRLKEVDKKRLAAQYDIDHTAPYEAVERCRALINDNWQGRVDKTSEWYEKEHRKEQRSKKHQH